MFGPEFYRTVLPDRIRQECAARPGQVPVVQLKLGDGAALDVCHIIHLADRWLAVAYFRDTERCEEMDIAFLAYEFVTRVTFSLHDPRARRLGFRIAEPEAQAVETGVTT